MYFKTTTSPKHDWPCKLPSQARREAIKRRCTVQVIESVNRTTIDVYGVWIWKKK